MGRYLRLERFYFIVAGVLAILWFREAWIGFGILLGVASVWPLFRVWLALPLIYFDKLNKAKDWHQWSSAVALVDRIETFQRFHFIKIPAVALTQVRALGLVGAGKMDEGLKLYQTCENKPGCPSWLYKSQ